MYPYLYMRLGDSGIRRGRDQQRELEFKGMRHYVVKQMGIGTDGSVWV
jgi:hypothetical protein